MTSRVAVIGNPLNLPSFVWKRCRPRCVRQRQITNIGQTWRGGAPAGRSGAPIQFQTFGTVGFALVSNRRLASQSDQKQAKPVTQTGGSAAG
jgi:hypothetical protein